MKDKVIYQNSLCLLLTLSKISTPIIANSSDEPSHFFLKFGYFFMGILVGALVIYFYSQIKIYSILSNEKNKYLKTINNQTNKYLFKYLSMVEILKESKDSKLAKIEKINEQLQTTEKELKKITQKVDEPAFKEIIIRNESNSNTNDARIIETTIEPIELEIESKTPPITTIYFTIPEENGSFKKINGKETKEEDCFYKIESDESKQKGYISFIPGPLMTRALESIDYYLRPVCDIENIENILNAKKIEMIRKGSVTCKDEIWTIDINAKIKIKLL